MASNSMAPEYLLPTPEETEAAASIADGRVPRIYFTVTPAAVDLSTQQVPYHVPAEPIPTRLESFIKTAEAKGFTPTVIAFREGGLPARDLQTGRNTLFPKGASLILGFNVPGTASYQVARLPEKHYTVLVDAGDLLNRDAFISPDSLKFLQDEAAEPRNEGFYGLQSLYTCRNIMDKSISAGSGVIRIPAGVVFAIAGVPFRVFEVCPVERRKHSWPMGCANAVTWSSVNWASAFAWLAQL